MNNLQSIFETLGINKGNGLYTTKNIFWQKECNFSNRVKKLIKEKLKPEAFFVLENKPLILFYDSPRDKEQIHRALWNFNESPVIIFADISSVEIFNGFRYVKEKASLESFGSGNDLNDFTYFEIVSGRTWEKYQSELKYENRVDHHLLSNIKAARKILISIEGLNPEIANALIGKVIFIRYLIDRKVKMGFEKEKYWTNDDFCRALSDRNRAINFFKYLEEKFNGDMFMLDDSEYQCINQNSLNTIINLLNEENLGDGQQSLFKLYDFSIIPVEFISNIYESFIGESNQKNEGAYYTPLFLVDYILNETVEKYHLNYPGEYNCKVLDPACGSGIFLVETLRKIIERYIALKPDIIKNTDEFKENLRTLAIDNIFGIDKNIAALQVAIFSIQLTLLDYQQPSSIETFKFPKLLDTNFFNADFFDTAKKYNAILKDKKIQFILGNPPWKGSGMGLLGKKYLNNRKRKEKGKKHSIAVNNGEIAEGFILRASDFTNPNTEISLIVRSSILYNLGYNKKRSAFRDYWTEEFYINKVFELAPVRKEVFDKSNDPSIAPAAILFYKYADGKNTDNNIIEHITLKPSRFFSMFKIFLISRNDIKNIEQKRLKDYDWLWKVLVYGSYLDFNFIKSLKENYQSIGEIIKDKESFVVSTGIHSRRKDVIPPKNTREIKDFEMIKTDAIGLMFIDYNKKGDVDFNKIDIIKDKRIYKAPMLLIRKGLEVKKLRTKSAISDRDIIFKDGITAIKTIDQDRKVLAKISALLYSDLYSYFAINTFASIGIEREQAQNYNKFTVPFINCEIENLVNNIEKFKKRIKIETSKLICDEIEIRTLEDQVNDNLSKINNKILNELNLNDEELALIDYALKINRPIITRNSFELEKLFRSFTVKENGLENYANLFLNRFGNILNAKSHRFFAEIWQSRLIIGIFFKIGPVAENTNSIIWKDKSNEELLNFAMKLSSNKITERLFVQKDLRGFEEDYFYIFKPNEKRLWHKAIGYQDVDEFMDAILKTGRRMNVG